MRLVISRDCFVIERVPHGIDLSDLRAYCGVSWDGRRRRFAGPLADALMVRRDLERRGVHLADEVVRAAVLSALEHDPLDGTTRVAEYGDARALPELSRALDDYRQGECAATDFLTVIGLATAIDILGGETTEAQRGKIAEFERRQRDLWRDGGAGVLERLELVAPLATFGITRPTPARRTVRPGRNDPCPCGSGRKYKLCHLDREPSPPGGGDVAESEAAERTRH